MMIRTLSRTVTHALLAAVLTTTSFGLALAPAHAAEAEPVSVPVADYTVFVDPPTGFAFVKLPAGWTFVGPLTAEDVARLPGNVTTALLAAPRVLAAAEAR